jgi:hypothetical protein
VTLPAWSPPTRKTLPIILIRGFGGLGVEDEKRIAYQGFNDGTVYPQKRGENYIYEGLVLRFLKSHWRYQDATNVVGYYPSDVTVESVLPRGIPRELLKPFEALREQKFFHGGQVIIDPGMALELLKAPGDPLSSLWVFRYYDLNDRRFITYGRALVKLINFIRSLCALKTGGERPKVNIIAHSMGGLIVREAVQRGYRLEAEVKAKDRQLPMDPATGKPEAAERCINKIVTLGTPHRGISFQVLQKWIPVDARDELEHFNPKSQEDSNEVGYKRFHEYFPLERLLTVVGTNYRTYGVAPASWLNRLFSVSDETGLAYNRSDGLVQQASAQIPGALRTFVHKCHGGPDSLVTSREAYEIATRFFFGNVRARLRLLEAHISRGKDLFGKSEFVFGVSIKPRRVDFDLFHQSAEAENCYGPFSDEALLDAPGQWADPERLIWEGFLDVRSILLNEDLEVKDMVLRLDFYVGERDLLGIGFSDNVIFRKQYYVRAVLGPDLKVFLHTNEEFMRGPDAAERKQLGNRVLSDVEQAGTPEGWPMLEKDGGWEFRVEGTGFKGRLRVQLDAVPETGPSTPLTSKSVGALASSEASAGVPVSPA